MKFLILSTMFFLLLIPSCRHKPIVAERQVNFADNKYYEPYMYDVVGTDYGFKVLWFIKITSPMKKYIIEDIWKQAGIKKEDRKYYAIVNAKYSKGMAWSAFLFGETQMSIHADVAKRKNIPVEETVFIPIEKNSLQDTEKKE